MTIYLARHGQTTWNTQGRKQGQGDSPLTELGIRQAASTAQLLARLLEGNREPVEFHVSPLKRARDTASRITNRLGHIDFKQTISDAIMEINYGCWEGLTNEDVDERYPGQRKLRNRDRWNYVFDEGESYQQVAERVANWFDHLTSNVTHIIITHDMISRLIRGHYLGLANTDTLALTHPHEQIFKLDGGEVSVCY